MRLRALICIAMLLPPLGACAQQVPEGPPPVRATFALIDSTGVRVGQVMALQDPAGVVFQVLATGLTPGLHGMHLHVEPACDPPSFAAAGGHYNPSGRQHGRLNPAGPHAGDFPNLTVQQDGSGRAEVRIDGVTLTEGDHSIGRPGSALVLHVARDDELTDPTGNSGARVACAVIRSR